MVIGGTFCNIEVFNDDLHTSSIQKVPQIAIDRPYIKSSSIAMSLHSVRLQWRHCLLLLFVKIILLPTAANVILNPDLNKMKKTEKISFLMNETFVFLYTSYLILSPIV